MEENKSANEHAETLVGACEKTDMITTSIAYTINLSPKWKRWATKTTRNQKMYLSKVITFAMNSMKKDKYKITNHKRCYEYCKSGYVHVHGYITLDLPRNIYTESVIQDFSRHVIRIVKKDMNINLYYDNKYWDKKYSKYVSPLLCVKIVYRLNNWIDYMNKSQLGE